MEIKKILLSLLFLVTCYAATIAQKVKIKTGGKVYYINKDSLEKLKNKKQIHVEELKKLLGNASSEEEIMHKKNGKKIQHGNLSINYGLSHPIGKFASDDAYDEEAGMAVGGNVRSLRFSYIFQDRIGISIGYKKHKNHIDPEPIEDIFEDYYNRNFIFETSSPWIINSFLIGPSVNLIHREPVIFDIDVQFGISFCKGPELRIKEGHNAPGLLTEAGQGDALSFSTNGKFIFFVSDKFTLNIGYGYLTSKPRIAYVNDDAKQPINFFELDFGVGLRIK